ncbi:MAG: hypothetical protein KF729_35035 [Sandaracinaceae bacterium]|nr:hypothetical protein [Sandaracinaceae bacterium]
MDERELTPREGGFALWTALGCGGVLLALICLVPPAAIVWAWRADAEPADPVATGEPPPPPVAPPDPVHGPGWPDVPPPPLAGATSARHVSVRITEVSGVAGLGPGTTCSFPVTRHDRPDGTFWCRAEITCAGRLLYGGGDAGYFDCTLYEQPQRHVVGQDFDTTSGDRDAAMRLDTLRGELEVRDDARGRLGAFRVLAQVTEVR